MSLRKKRRWLAEAEKEGVVADSLDVRIGLMDQVKAGKITLAEAQKELRKIKRNAKANGKVTRNQAFNGRLPSSQQTKESDK